MSEAAQVEYEDQVEDAAPDEDVVDNELSVEERAKLHGHKPLEEFKGDPADYKDAETFLREAEERLPIAVANQRALEKKLEAEKRRNDKLEKYMQMNIEIARAEIEKELRDAVEAGDYQAHEAALKRRDNLNEFEAKEQTPQIDPAVEMFMERNSSWYGSNQDLTAFANGLSATVNNEHPDWTVEQNLKEVERRMQPYLGQPRPRPAPVESARKRVAAPKTGFNSLDAEMKDNFKSLVRQKLYADNEEGRAKYYESVKRYEERHGK